MGDFHFQPPLVCHGHTRPIVDLQYSPETPDGVFLISASKDGFPMLRRGETGDWVGTFQGHKGAVWAAALDDAALVAATGSADFSARVWNAVTGDLLHEFAHKHIVRAAAFSHGPSSGIDVLGRRGAGEASPAVEAREGGAATSAGQGGAAEGGAAAPAGSASTSAGSEASATAGAAPAAAAAVSAVPTSPEGSAPLLATGGPERLIRVFDLGRPEAAPAVLEKTRDSVRRLLWTADDQHLLAGYLDAPGLDVFDPSTGQVVKTIPTRGAVRDLSATSDPDRIVLADGHDVILLRGLEVERVFSPTGCTEVESGAVALERGLLAAGGADMWVHLYDLETGRHLDAGKGHHGPVHILRFAPDLDSLASGSEDGTIRIWATGRRRDAPGAGAAPAAGETLAASAKEVVTAANAKEATTAAVAGGAAAAEDAAAAERAADAVGNLSISERAAGEGVGKGAGAEGTTEAVTA